MSSVSLGEFVDRLSRDFVDAPCGLDCLNAGSCPDSSDPSVCVFARDYVSFHEGACAMFDALFPDCSPCLVENRKPDVGETVLVKLTMGGFQEVRYDGDNSWVLGSEVFHDQDIEFWLRANSDLLYNLMSSIL